MDLLLDILPFWKYVSTNKQCGISGEKRWGRRNRPAIHTKDEDTYVWHRRYV
jgi:hypothetical protein